MFWHILNEAIEVLNNLNSATIPTNFYFWEYFWIFMFCLLWGESWRVSARNNEKLAIIRSVEIDNGLYLPKKQTALLDQYYLNMLHRIKIINTDQYFCGMCLLMGKNTKYTLEHVGKYLGVNLNFMGYLSWNTKWNCLKIFKMFTVYFTVFKFKFMIVIDWHFSCHDYTSSLLIT